MTINSAIYGYMTQEVDYPDGAVIVEEGSRGDWVYVIIKGRAAVRKRTAKGLVTIAGLSEGDIIGEMAFLEGGKVPRSASVIAADGPVRVGVLDNERLVKDYDAISPQLRTLIKSLIYKMRDTTAKVCAIVVASA